MKKDIIGDNFSITINFKWLLQLLALVAAGAYSIYTFQLKLNNMDNQIAENMSELQELIKIHDEESAEKMSEMEETLKWYQQELINVGGIGLNPLSWGKNKK